MNLHDTASRVQWYVTRVQGASPVDNHNRWHKVAELMPKEATTACGMVYPYPSQHNVFSPGRPPSTRPNFCTLAECGYE